MTKRGRKPKERKGYFYEEQEEAVVKFVKSTDEKEKNELFNNIIHPALIKMVESIIRTYKLFIPDEEFDENFNDAMSYLLSKIHHYDINKGRAYSYLGNVCKNYVRSKCIKYCKNKKKNTPYEDMEDNLINNKSLSVNIFDYNIFLEKLFNGIRLEIQKMIEKSEYDDSILTEGEKKVGNAILIVLNNWDEIFEQHKEGVDYKPVSNKLQKSRILYILREETMMSTKEVRDNMKKFKIIYQNLKEKLMNEDDETLEEEIM